MAVSGWGRNRVPGDRRGDDCPKLRRQDASPAWDAAVPYYRNEEYYLITEQEIAQAARQLMENQWLTTRDRYGCASRLGQGSMVSVNVW